MRCVCSIRFYFATVKKILLLLILVASLQPVVHSQRTGMMDSFRGRILFAQDESGDYNVRRMFTLLHKQNHENPRLVAIALNATLGLLGMHRLYLGTDLMIPIAYTLTLGGGCVLWIADLGLLIFSKDIEKFYDNPHLFMWVPNG